MKNKEELNALKEEVEAVNKKLAELTEEELKQVTGGADILIYGSSFGLCPKCGGPLWCIIDTDYNAVDIVCECGFYDPGPYPINS